MAQHIHLSLRIANWVFELEELDNPFTMEHSTIANLVDVLKYCAYEKRVRVGNVKEQPLPLPLEDVERGFTSQINGHIHKTLTKHHEESLSTTLIRM